MNPVSDSSLFKVWRALTPRLACALSLARHMLWYFLPLTACVWDQLVDYSDSPSRVQNKKFESVSHFSKSSWIWLAMCTKWVHHAEILIGHFREMVGHWPVASCYLTECNITAGHWPMSDHFSKMANQNFSTVHSLCTHGQLNSRRIGKMADHLKFLILHSESGIIFSGSISDEGR